MLFFILGLALFGLLLLAVLVWKYPVGVAAASIAVACLSDVIGIGQSGIQLGVTIYPMDLSCAALAACCIVVSLRTRSLPRAVCWPALALLALGLLNFGRGVLVYGVRAPGNDARDLIYLVFPAVAFSCLRASLRMDTERLVTWLTAISIALAVIAIARWAGVLAMPEDDYQEEFREIVRVLPSDHAMVIGQALIGILGAQLIRGFRTSQLVLAGIFAALVLALQHRSVWMATAAGLIWLALRSPRLAQREWLKVSALTLLLASAIAIAPLFVPGPFEKALSMFDSNVQEIGQDDSTWAWRVQGYTEATDRVLSNGLIEMAVGPASGQDLSNTASFASIHIHDRYIHTLAYYGIGGLLTLIVWLVWTAAKVEHLPSGARRSRIDKAILEAMLISAVIYFVPYTGGQMEGVLLGAIWLVSTAYRQVVEGTTPAFRHTLLSRSRETKGALETSYGLRSKYLRDPRNLPTVPK